jgi:CelD/BcsL family acetyltransferase involved in cellulose biosynthesis
MMDLAERGLLLSYMLNIGGRPCALASGTRFKDTQVVHCFRHDAQIAHLSPGTVLQTLMMKDLIENKLARRIDYGFGEPRCRQTTTSMSASVRSCCKFNVESIADCRASVV